MTTTNTNSLPPLTIHSNHFHQSPSPTSPPFLFRGLVYQLPFPRPSFSTPNPPPSAPPLHLRHAPRDPLCDAHYPTLLHHLPLFLELNINVLWIYTVCPGIPHTRAMKLLAAHGIYVFIGLSAPGEDECINRLAPVESYTKGLLRRCYEVVDAFGGFGNVAGFVVADQVVNEGGGGWGARGVVRGLVRDVKGYVEYGTGRKVPVGVADGEWAAKEGLGGWYAAEGEGKVDFWACTMFGKLRGEGWREVVEKMRGMGVPVLVSEYGAWEERERRFERDVGTLYGRDMLEVFSGGCAYEFVEGSNRYGLVKVDEEGEMRRLKDFELLREQMQRVSEVDLSSVQRPVEEGGGNEVDAPILAATEQSVDASEIPGPTPLTPEEYSSMLLQS